MNYTAIGAIVFGAIGLWRTMPEMYERDIKGNFMYGYKNNVWADFPRVAGVVVFWTLFGGLIGCLAGLV